MTSSTSKSKKKKYVVYMLRCGDDSLYVGVTNNLEKRLKEHSEGKRGARYTRSRRPVSLVYTEVSKNKSAALKREYVLKQLSRSEKAKLVW
jgi:putative endonuclease